MAIDEVLQDLWEVLLVTGEVLGFFFVTDEIQVIF